MPRNKKPKHRVLDAKQMNESNGDTVITNLAANEDNVSPMDQLKVLQEMFSNRIEPDVVHDVFQEYAFNAEQTLESLLELCNTSNTTQQYLPFNAQNPSNSMTSSQNVITEVPPLISEPPLNDNTNDNCLTQSTTQDLNRSERVHNFLPMNPQSQHHSISPFNAVMPFASLFSPKNNISFNNCSKSSHQMTKVKKISLKDEIKSIIQSGDEKVLVILRGLPGSGKSTLANYLVNGCIAGVILSTDQYFIHNGVYKFDPTQLPIAHEWNQKRAKNNIMDGKSPIIIDNTNLEMWEMKPYVSLGYSNGYKIYFLEPDTAWNRNPKELSKRNIHNIPKEKIEYMVFKFEKLTVEDVIKSLPVMPFNKLNCNEKSVNKSFTETKAVTNNALKDMKISLSNSNPSSCSTDEFPQSESSPSSLSAKLEEMPSSPSQRESSTTTTEPTSPDSPSRIDIDLLLALSERHVDSEDNSSVNASEDGSSGGVDHESGWERDEEFTWSLTNNQTVFHNNENLCKQSVSTNIMSNEKQRVVDPEPKPKREKRDRSSLIKNKDNLIEEENSEDLDFSEKWEEEEEINNQTKINTNLLNNISESSEQTHNNRKLIGFRKQHNWEFPPFPINVLNNTNDKSKISITCYSRQTQTERKDWALLELSQSNKPKEGLETDNSEEEDNLVASELVSNSNPKLDKGTFTCDFPDDMTRDQKLDSLRINFPKAEDSHLKDILDACHENYNWAKKLLNELNDDHFEIGTLEQLPFTNESSPEIDSEINDTFTASAQGEESEVPSKLVQQNISQESDFVLTLDPNLAAQLELHFGPLSDKTPLSGADLTLNLSHGVARLLHHNWKKSLSQKSSTQSIPHSLSKLNINHNFIDYKSKALILEQNTPKTEFQEIMDFELAMSLSRQEYDDKITSKLNSLGPTQNPLAKELMSTRMKRDQLYRRYPGVDKGFLDEIFESNKFCLGKTIEVIDNSLGESVDFSNETEALIAEERVDSPLNNSRSTSPSKSIRRVIDINVVLAEINSLLTKKKEYHDKAQIAYQRKMFAVASYYGDEASKFFTEIDRLSKDIVDYMLNTCTNSNELDLHGLHIAEVNVILAEYLRRKLDELKKTPGKRKLYVDIITGYGATKGIQGRIKPIVIQYLKQKNFTFEIINMGVIRVILTQQT